MAFENNVIDYNYNLLESGNKDLLCAIEVDGMVIHDPYISKCGRFEVDPIKEYGEDKINEWNKKIKDLEKIYYFEDDVELIKNNY